MPKSRIDETLKKIASATPRENTPTTSSAETLGNPGCPICGGLGYIQRDLPVGHPDFGKLEICSCRQSRVVQQVRERLYSLSHLDELSHLTFDTFLPVGQGELSQFQADSLLHALNSSKTFSQNLEGWLLLLGGYGCGKTHLAAAIANAAVGMGVPTIFLTVPDLLDTLRFTFDSQEIRFEERFEEIRNAKLLILDDFGTQNATGWAQEKLFQIINYRYINRLPLVVTTNLSLEELESRIRSRFNDRTLVQIVRIDAPDYRLPRHALSDSGHSTLQTLSKRTFETFSNRQNEGLAPAQTGSLSKAHDAAAAYAEKPQGWLVFLGGYSTGKTHLAAAIANYASARGFPTSFEMVPDLLDHLRQTFNPNSNISYDRRFEEIRSAPLLILDDLGTQSMTPWAREKLYQIFNHRYNSELPTVVTTADPLEKIDERISSRLLDSRLCRIYYLDVPPYHTVLKKKAR